MCNGFLQGRDTIGSCSRSLWFPRWVWRFDCWEDTSWHSGTKFVQEGDMLEEIGLVGNLFTWIMRDGNAPCSASKCAPIKHKYIVHCRWWGLVIHKEYSYKAEPPCHLKTSSHFTSFSISSLPSRLWLSYTKGVHRVKKSLKNIENNFARRALQYIEFFPIWIGWHKAVGYSK